MPPTPDKIAAIVARREKRLELINDGFSYQDATEISAAETLPPYHHLDGITWEEFTKGMHSKWWRMNNLYYIIDKEGKKVLFKCKATQRRLFNSMWHRLLDLKARQLGGTTFFALYFLDDAMFIPNLQCDIIAHRLDDAKKIFRKKIVFAYENLPAELRAFLPLKRKASDEWVFGNGSSISVTVSSRSGTPNRLHVSEFGKICAQRPETAREIMTGALPAVPRDGIAAFESTAEGNQGYFAELCKTAQDLQKSGRKPNQLEFDFFFAAWWEEPEYSLPPDQYIPIPIEFVEYFKTIEAEIGHELTQGQRCWWYSQYKILGDDMYRENPSTPKEAFLNRILGAYFTKEFDQIRREKRICKVPHNPSFLVDTWWDLGMRGFMAIWFTQDVGRELHVIDYLESNDAGFPYYAELLEKKKYRYGVHNGPHDISVKELGYGETRWQSAKNAGIHFNRIKRAKNKLDSIDSVRMILPVCWFDETHCSLGLNRLENYRREWDENLKVYKRTPLEDENCHGSDAFQTLSQGHAKLLAKLSKATGIGSIPAPPPPPTGGWT